MPQPMLMGGRVARRVLPFLLIALTACCRPSRGERHHRYRNE